MRVSPVITLGLSVSFGVAAILVARQFTTQKNEQAEAPVELVELEKEVTLPVVVAMENLGRGDVLDAAVLAIEFWPEKELPYGYFASIDDIGSNQFSPRKAMTDIQAGEPLLDSRLSPAGMRPSLAGRLEPGFRAYTISMDDIAGVAGFVLPGDHIDIIYTKDSNRSGRTKTFVSEVLLSNVEVLGLGLNDDLSTDQPSEFHNATLAVSVEDVKRLSVAAETGRLSMALRGTRDKDTAVVVAKAEPVVRPPRRTYTAARTAPKTTFETVQVTLGEATTNYTVPVSPPPQ